MSNKKDNFHQIKTRLQESGIRPTMHRIKIAGFMLGQASHPTADQVKEWADKNLPTISLATIYNTLNEMVAAGLLREYRFPGFSKTIYDNRTSDHYHFYDVDSGTLFDIDPADVSVQTHLPAQFEVEQLDIMIKGRHTDSGQPQIPNPS